MQLYCSRGRLAHTALYWDRFYQSLFPLPLIAAEGWLGANFGEQHANARLQLRNDLACFIHIDTRMVARFGTYAKAH